jgi:hypothetical protein
VRRALAAALLAGLAACAPTAEQAGTRRAPPAQLPLDAAAARLPGDVAGFTRGDTVWHERERPGQGVSVDYAGPSRSAVATVSLYDRGGGPVADDPARLEGEFQTAVAEVVASADRRTNQRMTERERSQLAVPGGAPLSCSRLDGLYGRQEVRTIVCLGAAGGRFLKVQVTSPGRQVRPVDPLPFIQGVAQAARG